jgi:lysozyme
MIKRFYIGLTVIVLLLIAATCSYFLGYVRFNYPAREQFPVRGVDVSHHQGDIDWQLLKSERVVFAYIKATEGGDFKDPRFRINWEGAIHCSRSPVG